MTQIIQAWPATETVRPRVLILAADLLTRAGLASILTALPDLDVVGQAPLDQGLEAAIQAFRPDVLLCDFTYANEHSLAHLEAFLDAGGDVAGATPPVLALLADVDQAAFAWQSGIRAMLLRNALPATLAAALRATAAGLVVQDPRLGAPTQLRRETDVAPASTIGDETLTPREQEVLQLIAQGLANKTIARTLQISEHTVKFHVNAILAKLGAQSRTDAVVRASRAGLVLL